MCSICNVVDWNLNGKKNYCSNCGAKNDRIIINLKKENTIPVETESEE